MKKDKATDPEMVQAQKDLAKMSNLSDRVITNDNDLFQELAWDNEEDERDYPLHTFSLKALLSLGDYYIELNFKEN